MFKRNRGFYNSKAIIPIYPPPSDETEMENERDNKRRRNKRAIVQRWLSLIAVAIFGIALFILINGFSNLSNIETQIAIVVASPIPTSVSRNSNFGQPNSPLFYADSSVSILGYITTARLNLRAEPNASSYIVFRISFGDAVQIIGRNSLSTWLLIDVGRIGWINAEYVTTSGQTDSLPVYTPQQAAMISPSQPFNFICPGARFANFQRKEHFIIPYGDGPTSMWTEPNGPPRITRIPEGQGGTILAGPICTGGQEGNLVWWYARSDSGYVGYISEGYTHSRTAWIAR